jgi:7-cyano-7-deazaguanine synthase
MKKKSALVLLSGGQDSCTCLAWACTRFDSVYTIGFDYNQRHRIELECSQKISLLAKAKEHFVVPISSLSYLGGSALVQTGDINSHHVVNHELPASFVPGRNYLFLGLAAAKAYQLGIQDLITGVCETDFSGYCDCRDNSIKAIQVALSLCLGINIYIHTPLMWLTKAETVQMMIKMGCLDWYKDTHTCYEGQRPPCGECPACKIRAKGFKEAGIVDPLLNN